MPICKLFSFFFLFDTSRLNIVTPREVVFDETEFRILETRKRQKEKEKKGKKRKKERKKKEKRKKKKKKN